jgi:hypothetical protein
VVEATWSKVVRRTITLRGKSLWAQDGPGYDGTGTLTGSNFSYSEWTPSGLSITVNPRSADN